ncbi:MAG: hypothetical protein KKG64_01700 [Firmicutes bacterium]|nr:hypothetical protein [Bacillota bacterium]
MLFTLHLIAQQLNKEKIIWALGGSNVLKKYGIIDQVNDIDILVMQNDIEKADQILSSLGNKISTPPSSLYLTSYFYQYEIRQIKVDLMCDFKIKYNNQVYTYIFDQSSITDVDHIANIDIFYTSLEDWYVLYRLMKRNDEDKVKTLEKHFMLHGVKHRELILRTLEQVPNDLKFKIKYQLGL